MTLIAHVFTSSKFVPFVLPLLVGLRERGYELCTISGDGTELHRVEELGIPVHRLAMTRTITPGSDVKSLTELSQLLAKIQPDVVHAHNPKAGLLGMLAAWLVGAAPRIYHVHGSPILTATGFKRAIFWLTESVSHSLATASLAVSPSLRTALAGAGVLGARAAEVLVHGSASGIDVGKFTAHPDRVQGFALRENYQIPHDALVVGFAGRLIEEKGLIELRDTWARILVEFPSAWLVVAGAEDGPEPEVVPRLFALERVVRLGHVMDMVGFYEALDVFVLPSYREGLSTVLLEALSCHVAAVAARAVGTVDVVEAGVTGLLVPPRDAGALTSALRSLLVDAGLRHRLGAAGRALVERFFEREVMLDALVAFYSELGFPPP